jgi:transposase InsO family protein
VKFLGFNVDEHGYSLDDEHRKVVGEMKAPTDRKVLRSFLGLTSYHRQFVANYVKMTAALSDLMNKQNPWLWTSVHQDAFNKVVSAIVLSGKLYHIDYNLALFVRTDASTIGVGGMLYQIRNGIKEIIAYVAKRFSDPERRWSTIEQECYAMYYAIIHWEGLLLGQRFTVETDHANLQFLNKTITPKCVRWRTRLQEFTFTLVHIAGSDNQVADALSRCLVVCSSKSVDDEISMVHNSIIGHHGVLRTVQMLQEKEINMANMKDEVTTFITSCPLCQKIRLGQGSMDAALHSSMVATPGEVWCIDTMGPYPADEVGMEYIIVAIDAFTRYAFLFPTKDKSAKSFIACMINIIGHFGFMKEIRTDNAGQFTAKEVSELLQMFKVEHQLTIPFRHEANGLVERTNREVGRHLQALVAQASRYNSWSLLVPLVQRIINMAYNKNIGTNPARLVYGDTWHINHDNLHPGLPVIEGEMVYEQYVENLNENIQLLVNTAQSVQDKEIELRLNHSAEKPTKFLEGVYVLVNSGVRFGGPASKLHPKWLGPYIIVEVLSDGNSLRVQHLHTMVVICVHITMVKIFHDSHVKDLSNQDAEIFLRAFAALDSSDNVIQVITDHHVYGSRSKRCGDPNKVQFQISWVGGGDLTWHDYHEVKDTAALSVYLAAHPELRFK